MQTLSYGFKLPETGDRGSVWFPALEDNITQLNSHDHNGVNSKVISSAGIDPEVENVTDSGWTSDPTWGYKKQISFPAGYTNDLSLLRFVLNGGTNGGTEFYPKTEYIDNASLWLYMPVNNQAVDIYFL